MATDRPSEHLIGTRKLLDVVLSLQGVQIETVEAGHRPGEAAAATAEEG